MYGSSGDGTYRAFLSIPLAAGIAVGRLSLRFDQWHRSGWYSGRRRDASEGYRFPPRTKIDFISLEMASFWLILRAILMVVFSSW